MSTRLVNLTVDAADPGELARFWATFLGWRVAVDLPGEVDVRAPAGEGWGLDLVFAPVPEAKTRKNRVHLDLASRTPEHQAEVAGRALSLGARKIDVGQGDVPWVVLADPEGNEFCVLEPREQYARSGAVASIVVDSGDPAALAEFWALASGWPIAAREETIVGLQAPSGVGPWVEFLRNDDVKQGKNRLHLDVAPFRGDDLGAEVTRLIEAGAATADVGQGEVPWGVLADPEGNEFCVLMAR
ncbi:VOC family protein [Amycolatopsis sp. NPDC058986]|uniref:VOC family protein n=1 Tax=unclassified Amycolatopsis TaxID=2618356 RepID=UPI0036704B91